MKKKYINGNYLVSFDDYYNTRIYTALRRNEDFMPNFPDSIDLKITNKCSNNCIFCHEKSNEKGDSFNLGKTITILDNLPPYIEVAIGGGNILECYDDFVKLCEYLHNREMFPRVTINHRDLKTFLKLLENVNPNIISNLAIGVSIESFEDYLKSISALESSCYGLFGRNIVFHVIVGIFPYKDLDTLIKDINSRLSRTKLLILGFKQFGRAINLKIKDLDNWRNTISKLFNNKRKQTDNVDSIIGFDNLAIDQLLIKDLLLKSEWNSYFIGQDFSHTMYIDAVREEFAPTSRSPYENRCSWDSISILDYFKKNRKSWS